MNELTALPIGFFVGVFGTLIGAGGGFLLAPLLVLLEPTWPTERVTAFSLAVVAANATAGAISYARLRRIDLRSFPIYAAAAVPGAVLGAVLSAYIPRRIFDGVLGIFITIVGGLLSLPRRVVVRHEHGSARRRLTDTNGVTYEWRFELRWGVLGAMVVGLLSSLLGIGGGIIHVPFLVVVLDYPGHVATATSHAVLAVTATVATIEHLIHGDLGPGPHPRTILAACGALLGAPFGARLSSRFSGSALVRILAAALALVGIRLIVAALGRAA